MDVFSAWLQCIRPLPTARVRHCRPPRSRQQFSSGSWSGRIIQKSWRSVWASGSRPGETFQKDHLLILAEFFFSLRALGLDDPQAMLRYLEAHNADIKREVATNPLCRNPNADD